MSYTQHKKGSSGCGCGGGGCASCSTGACATDGGAEYVRPAFFGGQLLTEADLDRIVQYVVDKNRLHNRMLFGEGVACGLEVVCDPCDLGAIHVQPGYALDCCGNDIVVSCPVELNVNALVRDLRARGLDCTDPCAKDGTTRKYCLYVRYHEEGADPVAPYATDGSCGTAQCRDTRIRESYRFELRCTGEADPPDDLMSRVLCCIGDFVSAESDARRVAVMQEVATRSEQALERIEASPDDHYVLGGAYPSIIHQKFGAVESALSLTNAFLASPGAYEDVQPAILIDATAELAGVLVTWFFLDDAQREEAFEALHELEIAHDKLGEAAEVLRTNGYVNAISTVDRLRARATLRAIDRWLPQRGMSEPPYEETTYRASDEARLLVEGVAYDATLHAELRQSAAVAKLDLVQRVERGATTICTLPKDVAQVAAPPAASGPEIVKSDVWGFIRFARALTDGYLRYLRDCLCRALNPVCTPCDDLAVRLACIEVDGCEVVQVCNTSRQWILSAANFRYWMGPLRLLGRLLERFCCETPEPEPKRPPRDPKQEPQKKLEWQRVEQRGTYDVFSVLARPDRVAAEIPDLVVGELASTYRVHTPTLLRFTDFQRVARVVGLAASARAGELVRPRYDVQKDLGQPGTDDFVAALDAAPVRARLEKVIDDRVRNVEIGEESVNDLVAKSLEQALEPLRDELKTLKGSYAKLKKANETLKKRLDSVEKG